jgi:DNA replication protein DnaC
MRGQEAISIVGKEIYGDDFSIDGDKLNSSYKKVYTHFVANKRKGMFLIGNVGIGKTAMMKVMQRLFRDTNRRFKFVNSYDLKDLSEQITAGEIKSLYGYDFKCDLYIDDIGFSSDVRRYGNTVNIISEILMERYDLFISSGFRTHLSSNMMVSMKTNEKNIPTIETIYGSRVVDRLREMCELVTWNGDSLRK